MADGYTYTVYHNLDKPPRGYLEWHIPLNTKADKVDEALGVSVAVELNLDPEENITVPHMLGVKRPLVHAWDIVSVNNGGGYGYGYGYYGSPSVYEIGPSAFLKWRFIDEDTILFRNTAKEGEGYIGEQLTVWGIPNGITPSSEAGTGGGVIMPTFGVIIFAPHLNYKDELYNW